MTARHTLILDALGLGPRWLPRQPLAAAGHAAGAEQENHAAPDQPLPVSVPGETQATAQPGVIAAQPEPVATAPEPALAVTAPDPHPIAAALVLPDAVPPLGLTLDILGDESAPVAAAPLPSRDELQAQVAACQRCRLSQSRTQTVFGRGNPAARWLFVGEAPGEQEDLQGLPFVGPAGKLLDNMLAALGLDREQDIYIANVLKCRPPKNRNPQGDEIAACQPYLRQQIALQQPAVIVALGRFAAQTLLDSEASIGSLRGRVHQHAGVPLVVTYHPAYLLRSLPEKAKAWQDLLRARQAAGAG